MNLKKIAFTAVVCFSISFISADNVPPSTNPPGGLSATVVPQFVNIGFDDNACEDAMAWLTDTIFKNAVNPKGLGNSATYDGTPAHTVFYLTSNYGKWMKSAWLKAKQQGHEFGNHTVNHNSTTTWTQTQWQKEIDSANKYIGTCLQISQSEIWGFRTPSLEYNSSTFGALSVLGMIYDCTLHGGSGGTGNGGNFNWPYTLDNGSPGETGAGNHAGLWEIPTHYVVRTTGLKVVGLDYNMWVKKAAPYNGAEMTKDEFLSTLKNTLDLRYNGNRAPFTFGAHSDYYSPTNNVANNACTATWQERRAALKAFIDYALSKPDVRFVTTKDIIAWMRKPVALNPTPLLPNSNSKISNYAVAVFGRTLRIAVPQSGLYSLTIYSLDGRSLANYTAYLLKSGDNILQLERHNSAMKAGYIFINSNENRWAKKLMIE